MLPAGGYSQPTENQGIMDMETGEIIALSKKDQRIADAKKNRKEIMEKLQDKVDKENAESRKKGGKPEPVEPLKGTPKQIEWAQDIQKEFQQSKDWVNRISERINNNPDATPKEKFEFAMNRATIKAIEEQGKSDAVWWIENRLRFNLNNHPSFKSAAPRIGREILGDAKVKEIMNEQGWVPKRGEYLRIYNS